MCLPVAGWGDEVKENVDTVVAESWVTLDAGLLSENVIVLPLKVSLNLGEASLVVDLVSKAGGVDDGQRDARSFLIQLELLLLVSEGSELVQHIGRAHRL